MSSLDDLALFIAIADHQGITAAARALGLPKSNVSRRLSEYEARLDTTLFHRSTRALSLTEEGHRLYTMAKPAIDAALEVDRSVSESRRGPAGRVRITTTAAFGQHLIAPHIPSLTAAHPHIQLELRLTERRINMVSDGVDLALRLGDLEDSNLVARRLLSVERLVVAAPAYLSRRGHPETPADLRAHDGIVTRPDLSTWRFSDGSEAHPDWRVAAGNMLVAHQLARAGLGVALLPAFLIAEDLAAETLVRILPGYGVDEAPAWLLATPQRHRSPAVRAVMDHFVTAFTGEQ